MRDAPSRPEQPMCENPSLNVANSNDTIGPLCFFFVFADGPRIPQSAPAEDDRLGLLRGPVEVVVRESSLAVASGKYGVDRWWRE